MNTSDFIGKYCTGSLSPRQIADCDIPTDQLVAIDDAFPNWICLKSDGYKIMNQTNHEGLTPIQIAIKLRS